MLPLLSECALKIKDEIYFSSMECNLIYKLNVRDGKIDFITSVPDELLWGSRLFGEMLAWEDKIVFLPANAKNIWIADREFKNWEKIELNYSDIKMKFICGNIAGNILYAFRHSYNCSIYVNLETHEIGEIKGLNNDYFWGIERKENKLYCPACNSSNLYIMDLMSGNVVQKKLSVDNFNGLMFVGNSLYIIPRGRPYVVKLTNDTEKVIDTVACHGLGIFEFDNKIIVPSYGINDSLVIENDNYSGVWTFSDTFRLAKQFDEKEYCLMDKHANLYLFDGVFNKITRFKLEAEEEKIQQIIENKVIFNNNIFIENYILNLQMFLKEI